MRNSGWVGALGVAFFMASRAASAADAVELPSLAAIVERARTHGPAVRLARAELVLAESSRPSAGLPPLTNPYAELTFERTGSGGLAIAGAVFVPLELGGQRARRITEADALTRWKAIGVSAARASAVGEAVEAYGALLVAHERLRQARRGEAAARTERAAIAARVEASDATALDLSVADGELSYWVQTRAEAELDRTAARARLSVAIADPALPFPDDATTVTLPTLRAPTVAALIDRVTAASPSARALGAEASYYAAAKERWQAEAFAPVNVVLTGGRGDLGDARFGGGLAWTFPIFRRNQAEIARAEAEGARALSERSIVEATTTIRARGLWEAYQTAARTLADLEEVALPSARRAVEATLASHRAGKTELSRVAAARRDLARAEGKRLDMVGSGFHVFAELTALVGEVP